MLLKSKIKRQSESSRGARPSTDTATHGDNNNNIGNIGVRMSLDFDIGGSALSNIGRGGEYDPAKNKPKMAPKTAPTCNFQQRGSREKESSVGVTDEYKYKDRWDESDNAAAILQASYLF